MIVPYRTLADAELITSLKQGDHGAFTEIYDRNWGMLYIHALKLLHNEEESKDILQEIFIGLWTRSDTLDIKSSISNYLFSAVRNKVLNIIRDKKTRTTYTDLFALYLDDHCNATVDNIDERELAEAIEVTIQLLPDKMKEVFELSRKSYLSNQEIADKLNISDKTVKKQVNNALKILRHAHNRPAGMISAIIMLSILRNH
ncbi:MAG: polymerase subunit sigma-70 [Mucilaginibacter sp.]|nr:polymerase subunit sigma-70 [Mucilaginibacter sp.]